MLYFIETQKKMLTGDDSDSEEQEDLQLIAPQLIELFPHKENHSLSNTKVPSINILKVRNQQIKGNNKIDEDLDRRNHLTKDQRI